MKPPSQAEIEAAVLACPALSQAALAQRLGVKRARVRVAHDALVARGKLRVVGTGRGAYRVRVDAGDVAAPAPEGLAELRRVAAGFPRGEELDDNRRRFLLGAVRALAAWPAAQAVHQREGFLVDAVAEFLPEPGSVFGPAGAASILFGALVVPGELAEAVLWACGPREVATDTLRAAVAYLERDGGVGKSAGPGEKPSAAARQDGPPVGRTAGARSGVTEDAPAVAGRASVAPGKADARKGPPRGVAGASPSSSPSSGKAGRT